MEGSLFDCHDNDVSTWNHSEIEKGIRERVDWKVRYSIRAKIASGFKKLVHAEDGFHGV